MTVLRGAKRNYCFTVDGPWCVEPEDVPSEVTAALLEATKLYNIMVEGSRDSDIAYAVRFARRLAEQVGGAVLDQQIGTVWSKGASRTVEKPLRDSRVRVVTVDWYALRSDLDANVGHEYVIRCHRYLPEALPRRFGEFEPFQHKLAEVGEEGFARAWREAESLLFFSASAPCIAGALWAGPSEKHPRLVWHMSLELHCLPLTDRRWRDSLGRLFVSLAEHLNAFYASAQVTRDSIWNGRGLWSDRSTERPIQTARINGWMGLPPYPVWWSWYGQPYRDLVSQHLVGYNTTDYQAGLFCSLGDDPLDRDQLNTLIQGARPSRAWLSPELRATVEQNERRIQPVPIRAAELIPRRLT